jgi:hypothetical protein
MLELINQKAKFANFNVRAEIHGEDHIPAGDLKFEMDLDNSELAQFDPNLKGCFYVADEVQGQLVEDARSLLFPFLAPLKWTEEATGFTVRVKYGISEIILLDCRVNNCTLDLREGGTVSVTCRVQCSPSEAQCGKLCALIATDIELSMEPGESDAALEDEAA